MKQTAIKKRIVLFSILAAALLILLAVFGIQPIRREASAYDGTFYFRGDPVISTTKIEQRYRIRFNLIVSEDSLGINESVTVTLASNSEGAFIQRGHDGTTLTDGDTEGQTQSVSFTKSIMTFKSGAASVYVDMYLNVYERGRLTATCSATSAVSDEHTVVSATKILLDEGTAPSALAQIYDKYVGKDPTKEYKALSMVSNVVPRSYVGSSQYIAEIEIPSDIQTLGDKNLEELTLKSVTSIPAVQRYNQSGNYYALCATVSTKDPATQDINAATQSGIIGRRFYLLNNSGTFSRWMTGTDSHNFVNKSFSLTGAYTSNVRNAFMMSQSDGKYTVYFDFPTTAKATKLYFYVEVLQYYREEEFWYNSNNARAVSYQRESITSIFRSNVQASSLQDITKQILKNNSSLADSLRTSMCSGVGISTTEEKPLEVIYKAYSSSGNYETKSEIYNIGEVAAYNKFSAIRAMYNLSGIKSLAEFNIVSKKRTYDSETGQVINAGDKILRQALGYEYVYNEAEEKGYLTVVYDEFRYKDFSITIKNNEADNALEIKYYTATVNEKDGVVTLTYKYSDIEERLLNSCGWLFDLKKEDFTVTGDSDALVGVSIEDNGLNVRIPVKYQSDLFGLNITAVAQIVPDEEYQMKYVYYGGFAVSRDGKTITPDVTKSTGKAVKLSQLKRYNDYSNFMTEYGSEVNAPLEAFERQYGVKYVQPQNIVMSTDSASKSCEITVEYQKHSLFLVTDNLTDEWHYLQIRHTSNVYTGDEFVNARGGEVSGYRVDKITSNAGELKITNNYRYANAKAVLNADTYSGKIYGVCVNFTDEWLIEINYMRQYKETPFAEKTKYSGKIRVKDYPDIYALTSGDLAAILELKSMSIINDKVTVDQISVSYDGIGTYTVNTTYTEMSIVKRDSDGKTQTEIKVPLSCYKEWCEDYGKDWSILYLNYAGKVFFRYSNEIKPENLYGFFSVAIFDNKAMNLNDVFSSFDATGCMTFHSEEEVRGSRLYKHFRSDEGEIATILSFATIGLLTGHPITGAVIGIAAHRIALAFCESPISNDDNAIYYSYFFFLDGTSDTPMISESGSTDPTDRDSATKNTLQEIGDDISDFFAKLLDKANNSVFAKILAIGLPILLVLLLVVLAIRLVKWLLRK